MDTENLEQDTGKNLIKALQEFAPATINGAVVMHFDKETRELKSISPIVQASSIAELYSSLSNCRDAIQQFLTQMVDKGLAKN